MISFSGASVLVLIAMGFALGGIIGAILALPVAAIARDLCRLFFLRAQEQAGLPPAVGLSADANRHPAEPAPPRRDRARTPGHGGPNDGAPVRPVMSSGCCVRIIVPSDSLDPVRAAVWS